MKIQKIKNRGILFTHDDLDWDLNIYLIKGRKNNYVIDTGLGSLSIDHIKRYIEDDNRKTIVINTHYHWDHVWGNGSFKDCMIISHKLCRDMILSKWENMMNKNNNYCFGKVEMYLPNLVFQNELYFTEDKIRLFHTPGHTLDSISILDEEDKVLVLADNIGDNMNEIVPSIYCEKEVYIRTLEKYQNMDFDICISGHNKVLQKNVIGEILDIL
ncbi:MBL fold metallo-hydrolase [Sedimentibacter sp. MB31-C6]|uniref:MBL fold metallo-hydrolase n=1 Tax=Sedimentibacter sp. MB31-C6 TaxID=3109366 RepID=UPI002DDCD5FE|nr:MBL fold metallo-hydrolase [Sedimentibacter sp. MB36-C1]WSI03187.1 MBL fold metallo-hydrolase [Sedimentibacter sp. MB36-C1]